MLRSFKLTFALCGAFLCFSLTISEAKKVKPMESFTYDVYKDVQAVNIAGLQDVSGIALTPITFIKATLCHSM